MNFTNFILKHLAGKHDQKRHGKPTGPVSPFELMSIMKRTGVTVDPQNPYAENILKDYHDYVSTYRENGGDTETLVRLHEATNKDQIFEYNGRKYTFSVDNESLDDIGGAGGFVTSQTTGQQAQFYVSLRKDGKTLTYHTTPQMDEMSTEERDDIWANADPASKEFHDALVQMGGEDLGIFSTDAKTIREVDRATFDFVKKFADKEPTLTDMSMIVADVAVETDGIAVENGFELPQESIDKINNVYLSDFTVKGQPFRISSLKDLMSSIVGHSADEGGNYEPRSYVAMQSQAELEAYKKIK